MTTAWEAVGVKQVIGLIETKVATIKAREGDSNDAEFEALNAHVDALEAMLRHLGIDVTEDGMVNAVDAASLDPAGAVTEYGILFPNDAIINYAEKRDGAEQMISDMRAHGHERSLVIRTVTVWKEVTA